MRLAVLVAALVVAWAALINIHTSFSPLSAPHAVASAVLAAAVAVQRISSVQKWLSRPRSKRKEHVHTLAQQTLMNLCMGRKLTPEIMSLSIHVWEVPLWYRKLFPYRLRCSLKKMVKRRPLRVFSKWLIRPALHRVDAVGLQKPIPSGVRFCKGTGLIGVCIANNDRSEYLALKVSDPRYTEALGVQTDDEWQAYEPAVTHNLSRQDALKLSRSYGQVLARVVQDPDSGEAIGCVTVSVRDDHTQAVQIARDGDFKRKLGDLAESVADVLA